MCSGVCSGRSFEFCRLRVLHFRFWRAVWVGSSSLSSRSVFRLNLLILNFLPLLPPTLLLLSSLSRSLLYLSFPLPSSHPNPPSPLPRASLFVIFPPCLLDCLCPSNFLWPSFACSGRAERRRYSPSGDDRGRCAGSAISVSELTTQNVMLRP